jgi:hypothetical protein
VRIDGGCRLQHVIVTAVVWCARPSLFVELSRELFVSVRVLCFLLVDRYDPGGTQRIYPLALLVGRSWCVQSCFLLCLDCAWEPLLTIDGTTPRYHIDVQVYNFTTKSCVPRPIHVTVFPASLGIDSDSHMRVSWYVRLSFSASLHWPSRCWASSGLEHVHMPAQ